MAGLSVNEVSNKPGVILLAANLSKGGKSVNTEKAAETINEELKSVEANHSAVIARKIQAVTKNVNEQLEIIKELSTLLSTSGYDLDSIKEVITDVRDRLGIPQKTAAPQLNTEKSPQNDQTPPPGKASNGMKIIPNGVYNGAFLAEGEPALNDVLAYEQSLDEPLDMVMWFKAFKTGFYFPREVCDMLYNHGKIAPFIKLEPWSWGGASDKSFSLSDIISGKFDAQISGFAGGAAKWEKPLLVSFGHEMNGNWYPWGSKPEEFKAAYRHVVDLFRKNGANNATFVWNPNLEPSNYGSYYPGDNYVDVIGVDGYSWNYTGTPTDAGELFGRAISSLKQYGKPLFIAETAYDGDGSKEADFFKSLTSYAANNNLMGIIWFNLNKEEEGQSRRWKLDPGQAPQEKAALNSFTAFATGIKTAAGIPVDKQEKTKTAINETKKQVPSFGADFTKVLSGHGGFNGMQVETDRVANTISLKTTNANDAGLYSVLSQSGWKKLTFVYRGEIKGGYRNNSFTVICIKAGPDGDYTKDSQMGEFSFKPNSQPQTGEINLPAGTDKLNFMLVGPGSMDVTLSDLKLIE